MDGGRFAKASRAKAFRREKRRSQFSRGQPSLSRLKEPSIPNLHTQQILPHESFLPLNYLYDEISGHEGSYYIANARIGLSSWLSPASMTVTI